MTTWIKKGKMKKEPWDISPEKKDMEKEPTR